MKRSFCVRAVRAISIALTLSALFVGWRVQSQDCLYLPPGGPLAYGMLEITRIVVDSQVANSPMWLDDGRIAIGAALSSQAGYRRGAIWIYPPYGSSLHDYESFILPPLADIKSGSGAFGRQLAASGSWLAATARLTNDSHTVCLFEATSATGWTFRTNLLGNASASGDRFGDGDRAIALNGRWLAVIRYESSGRVHLYRVNDEGIWEQRQQLTIPGFESAAINDNTGVAIHGTTLAVGTPRNGNSSFTGRVDVWRLNQSEVWNYETNLTPATLAEGDRFGTSLALGPDKIFASAVQSDLITNNAGAIFLFERQNGSWTEVTQIAPPDISTLKPIGENIAYSDLGGEFLVDGTGNRIRMFQPSNGSWQQTSLGHPGRLFRNWESPAGIVKTYGYDATNTPIYSIAVRAHQVLTGFAGNSGFTMLHEHGWHAINAWHFSIDPPCSTRPVYYVPIGAPRNGAHTQSGDLDGDGLSDLAEIYFGTFLHTNQLAAGLNATLENGTERTVRWPRSSDPNLLISAYPEWSTNLQHWTQAGLTVSKVADEPDTGREIMETTLPDSTSAAYLRLQITLPPPPQ